MSTEPANSTSDRIDSQTTTDHVKQNQEHEEPKLPENEDGVREQDDDEGGGEDEGECGFCLFMKGGGCKDTFIDWEKCIEEAEKNKEDIVEKCFEVTAALKKCMEAHSDYYEPILRAEKAAEEEAVRELEKEAGQGAKEEEKIGSSETAKSGDVK